MLQSKMSTHKLCRSGWTSQRSFLCFGSNGVKGVYHQALSCPFALLLNSLTAWVDVGCESWRLSPMG